MISPCVPYSQLVWGPSFPVPFSTQDSWCTLWSGWGTTFAYIQTGLFGHAKAGTTLALSKKGPLAGLETSICVFSLDTLALFCAKVKEIEAIISYKICQTYIL